jgi:mitochondrial cardiolipin hydrolase
MPEKRLQSSNRFDLLEETPTAEVVFTRTGAIVESIERLVSAATSSIDTALYRLNSRRLASALDTAQRRGIRVRVLLDHNKYEQSQATRRLLLSARFPLRLTYGRDGAGSKMHHKFALLDDKLVLTGSYNWTFASEEQNYENLLILREPVLIEAYRAEFEALWTKAEEAAKPEAGG